MSDPTDSVNNDSTIPANVLPIKGKTKPDKAPKDEKPKEKKPKKADLYEMIFAAITDHPARRLPLTKFKIATTEISDGVKTPIEVSPSGECHRIALQNVADMMMEFTRTDLMGLESFRFTARDCRDCADYWQMASTPIPKPQHVRFGIDPGTCWNRLPFELNPGPMPLFEELFKRMTNARAVKAWIGSLFMPTSYRQQYVWIYGQGNDGKSALLEFLARVFGLEGALPQSKAPSGEHWAEQYPGKRFIYFPDFKDFSSLDNGPLKQITGGDRIYINPKHKPGYMAELECKLAFSSNHMPPIDLQKANLRRIIFAEMTSANAFDSKYDEKLWREGGAFLQSCIATYGELCPHHEPIDVSKDSVEALTAWGAREDDEYQLWFNDFLNHSTGSTISPDELTKVILYRFKDFKAKRACYDWLHKKGYRRERYGGRNDRTWIYKNIAVKPFDSSLH